MRRSGVKGPSVRWSGVLFVFLTLLITAPDSEGATKVVIAQSQDILAFAPAYVARAKFLPEAGVDFEFIITQGGGPTNAAVSSGSAHFGLTASSDLLNYGSRGAKVLGILAIVYQTQDVVVNRQWAEERNLTRDSPLADRLAALKDAVIGSTSAGAVSETLARYLVASAGLPPEQAQIVPIGGLNVRLAALKRNQIQAFIASPPAGPQAEAEGFGYVLIPSSDLPGFNRQIHEVVLVNQEWVKANPEVARKVATAFAKANNFVLEHPEEAMALIRPYFGNIDDEVFRASFALVQPQVVPNGLMSEEEWDLTQRLLRAIGAVESEVDITEGVFWTNEYIDVSQL